MQLTLRTSCFLHSCFFLKSAVCSVVRVKRWWRGCGCAVDVKGLLWPRPTLLQNTDSLFRPTHESHHRQASRARQGGGMGGSMCTRCCNGLLTGLIFHLASIQSDFSSSLSKFKCVWKPSLRPSGAGSEKLSRFFQDPGFGEGFLALKRSLGDAGRFSMCVAFRGDFFFCYTKSLHSCPRHS